MLDYPVHDDWVGACGNCGRLAGSYMSVYITLIQICQQQKEIDLCPSVDSTCVTVLYYGLLILL